MDTQSDMYKAGFEAYRKGLTLGLCLYHVEEAISNVTKEDLDEFTAGYCDAQAEDTSSSVSIFN